MKYLVTGFGGPGFQSVEDAVDLLEKVVHPTFDRLLMLEREKKVLVGGTPLGERAIVFVLDVDSHDEADKLIQSLPIWGLMNWKVVPLQDYSERIAQEKQMLAKLK